MLKAGETSNLGRTMMSQVKVHDIITAKEEVEAQRVDVVSHVLVLRRPDSAEMMDPDQEDQQVLSFKGRSSESELLLLLCVLLCKKEKKTVGEGGENERLPWRQDVA